MDSSIDRTGELPVQQVTRLGDSKLLILGKICKKYSPQFGWPILLLFLFAPETKPFDVRIFLFIGFPLILLGLCLRLWSRGYPRSEGFVLDGPYRYVRNPVELGALLIYSGAGITMRMSYAYLAICVFSAFVFLSFTAFAIDRELTSRHGTLYLRYANRISRWIPRILPGANRSNRTFSIAHGLSHEKDSLIWFVGYLLMVSLRNRF